VFWSKTTSRLFILPAHIIWTYQKTEN
jgi:hypothetical protein